MAGLASLIPFKVGSRKVTHGAGERTWSQIAKYFFSFYSKNIKHPRPRLINAPLACFFRLSSPLPVKNSLRSFCAGERT